MILNGIKFRNPSELFMKYSGKRCVIIGGGESISTWLQCGIDLWKMIDEEYTFGINRSYILGESTFHTCMDWGYWKIDEKYLTKLTKSTFMLPQVICTNAKLSDAYCLISSGYGSHMIPENFSNGICYGGSSGFIAMVCSYLMGFNPIYLLGFDLCGYHFHEGYGKEKDAKLARDHTMVRSALIEGIKILQLRGIEIISLSPISRLNDCIPYQEALLQLYSRRNSDECGIYPGNEARRIDGYR